MNAASPCPNCGAALTTPYCGQCGQRAIHGRLDLHEVWHDATHALLHADLGVVRLLVGLLRRPGETYRAYFAGARRRFFNPVLFLLLVEGVYIFSAGAVVRRVAAVSGRTPQVLAEAAVLQADKLKVFLGIPVVALVAWGLFRSRFRLAETLVFWCFCLGFITAVDMLGLPLQYAWPGQRETIKVTFGWIAGLLMAWHIFAVFGQRTWRSIVACVVLVLSSQVLLNYAYRVVYRLKGYDVPMGVVPTLRDSFGL